MTTNKPTIRVVIKYTITEAYDIPEYITYTPTTKQAADQIEKHICQNKKPIGRFAGPISFIDKYEPPNLKPDNDD